MKILKTRNNVEYTFDTVTKKFFNEETKKWVSNPRSSKKKFTKVEEEEAITLNVNKFFLESLEKVISREVDTIFFDKCVVLFDYITKRFNRRKRLIENNKNVDAGECITVRKIRTLLYKDYQKALDILLSTTFVNFYNKPFMFTNTKGARPFTKKVNLRMFFLTEKENELTTYKINTKKTVKTINKFNKQKFNLKSELQKYQKDCLNHFFIDKNKEVEGEVEFFVDNFSKRTHTNHTRLKKEDRQLLKIKNVDETIEETTEIDIVSCQAEMFFVYLANKKEIDKYLNQDITLDFNREKLGVLFRETRQKDIYKIIEDSNVDLDLYKQTESTKNNEKFDTLSKRAKSKLYWMKMVMGNSRILQDEFIKKHSTAEEYINVIQQIVENGKIEDKFLKFKQRLDYKRIAYILQNTEVYFVNKIKEKLKEENIIFSVIHDSIIVADSKVEQTKNIMQSILESTKVKGIKIKESSKKTAEEETEIYLINTLKDSLKIEDKSKKELSFNDIMSCASIKADSSVNSIETIQTSTSEELIEQEQKNEVLDTIKEEEVMQYNEIDLTSELEAIGNSILMETTETITDTKQVVTEENNEVTEQVLDNLLDYFNESEIKECVELVEYFFEQKYDKKHMLSFCEDYSINNELMSNVIDKIAKEREIDVNVNSKNNLKEMREKLNNMRKEVEEKEKEKEKENNDECRELYLSMLKQSRDIDEIEAICKKLNFNDEQIEDAYNYSNFILN